MKPIETQYKNHLFRSRLEAKYAVYFDVLGVEWNYETEGFKLSNGKNYLPDFYFPELSGWGEVKHSGFDHDSRHDQFIREAKKPFILFTGLPGQNPDQWMYYSDYGITITQGRAFEIYFSLNGSSFASPAPSPQEYPVLADAIRIATEARFEFQSTINTWSVHRLSVPTLQQRMDSVRAYHEKEFAKTGNLKAYKTLK